MKRWSVAATIAFAASCGGASEATIGGARVQIVSSRRVPEFKPAGSPRAYQAEGDRVLLVVELKANREIQTQGSGLSAAIEDDGGASHKTIFQQAMAFQDGHSEVTLLFEVPQARTPRTLVVENARLEVPR